MPKHLHKPIFKPTIMLLKTIIWILEWKLKVISNLNSPFRILKHYFKKLSMCFYFNSIFATILFYASISNLFLPMSLSMSLFQFYSCQNPFYVSIFIFLPLPSSFIFFLHASFYHLSVPSFCFSLFHFVPSRF
jgi:hypothetical protein